MLSVTLFRKFLFSARSGSLIQTISRLCIVGISMGVFAMIVVNSIMNGFHSAIRQRLLKVEPHLVVTFDKISTMEYKQALLKELNQRPLTRAYLFDQQDILLRTSEGNFSGAVLVGLDRNSLVDMLRDIGVEDFDGHREDPLIMASKKKSEIYIGKDLAYTLALYEGDEVLVLPPESLMTPMGEIPIFESAIVRGIISTNVSDVDAKYVYYVRGESMQKMRKNASWRDGIEIRLADPMQYSLLKNQLKARHLKVDSWVDRNSTLFFALKVEKTVIAVFLALSTFIGSFSIISVLALLLAQKKREFGILLALGISLPQARNIFVNVGLMLAGLGLAIGLMMGLGLSLYLQLWPLDILPKNIYYDTRISAQVDPLMVGWIFIGSIFVAFLGAWLAATQILNSNPVSSLRAKVQVPI